MKAVAAKPLHQWTRQGEIDAGVDASTESVADAYDNALVEPTTRTAPCPDRPPFGPREGNWSPRAKFM
ncbi:hypothetical protein ACF07V_06255 [Streptomyces sp. NPDC015661]|uniref:hypothetical protein n=1 Tax=Streptomyces sp. NPDC015661 TaxID=3364961 RepID=UPI0036FCD565